MPGDAAQAAEMRVLLREIFLHALAECSVERAFERHVFCERGILRVGNDLHDLKSYSRVFIVAFGKAAHSMAGALTARLGAIGAGGIICAPVDPPAQLPGFRYFRGGHPTPNQDSLRAAEAILRALRGLPASALVIFLISGGGSSLVEKPISDEISLADLIEAYRALMHSGAPIAEINAIRKHLSAVKGGRMAQAAAPAQQLSICVSDVPENALDSLASGPTMPDMSTVEGCQKIARQYDLLPRFPQSVRELFEHDALEETPKELDTAFARSRWWKVLSNADAQKAVAQRAAAAGVAVHTDNSCDDWDYRAAADHLLARLRELRKGAAHVCLISGGEVTVTIESKAGVGGRNQQFAAYCAEKIAGERIAVLSAGTDGIDGNSPAAGAIADGTTLARAQAAGPSVDEALAAYDTYPIFQHLGDAVVTGPTGNNLRDLRILLAY